MSASTRSSSSASGSGTRPGSRRRGTGSTTADCRIGLAEPLPDRRPDGPQVRDDGPGVVELVACRDQQHVRIVLPGQMRDVRFLTLPPRRLGLPGHGDSVGAPDHDTGDPVAELPADPGLCLRAVAGILDRIVQQTRRSRRPRHRRSQASRPRPTSDAPGTGSSSPCAPASRAVRRPARRPAETGLSAMTAPVLRTWPETTPIRRSRRDMGLRPAPDHR